MSSRKNAFKRVVVWFSRAVGGMFFSREYLTGRWFDQRSMGWKWLWRGVLFQKILGFNRRVPWPCSPFITISNARKIVFHPDDMNNFQTYGVYFQNFKGSITIGKGTYIAPNVGIITSNHVPGKLSSHAPGKDVVIGKACWIGMNSVLLPGVVLGDNTIVGAGSIVTKSFPEGDMTIVGNPAVILRRNEPAGGTDTPPDRV
jgi:hypothetical protein